MLYVNTFLDKLGEMMRDEGKAASILKEVESELVEMFRRDCEEILRLVEEGKADVEEAKRNFTLLKSYVLTQLSLHYEKMKEIAASKGIAVDDMKMKEIDDRTINEIAMMIEEAESKLG